MNTSIKNARKVVEWFLNTTNQTPDSFDLEELKDMFTSVMCDYPEFINMLGESGEETDEETAFELVKTCLNACGDSLDDLILTELFDLIKETSYNVGTDDFYIDDLPGGECRLIHEEDIERIHNDYCLELAKETLACHVDDLNNLPQILKNNISIEGIAEDLKQDPYPVCFATYDHEEHSAGNYYIFRTN